MDTNGNTVYSEVLMFLDRDENTTREFVILTTDVGAKIKLTPGHLILVWKTSTQITKYMFADQVEENDLLLVNLNNTLIPRRVVHIDAELHAGVYAPLTKEGTIIVNSITASCYALVDSQSIAHWSFMPIRALNSVQHWFDNTWPSSSLSSSSELPPMTFRQNGVHWYAKSLYSIKDYFLPSNWIYQT